MTDLDPIEFTNLDTYGNPALSWSRPRDILAAPPQPDTPGGDQRIYLGTVRPDGRPHAAGISPLWYDGDIYFTSGPETRKSRNLAANPACTISMSLEGIDLILEGEASRTTALAPLPLHIPHRLRRGYHRHGAERRDPLAVRPLKGAGVTLEAGGETGRLNFKPAPGRTLARSCFRQ